MNLIIYLLRNWFCYFFLSIKLFIFNVFWNLQGVDIENTNYCIKRHIASLKIVSAVNFHFSIHYILLNNFIWVVDVAGFVKAASIVLASMFRSRATLNRLS